MNKIDYRQLYAQGDFVRLPRLGLCIVAQVKEHSITVLKSEAQGALQQGIGMAEGRLEQGVAIPLEPRKANAVKVNDAEVPAPTANNLKNALAAYIASEQRAAHDALISRAEDEKARGRFDNAVRYCTEALSLFPDSIEARRTRAESFFLLNNYEAAKQDLTEVILPGSATAEIYLLRAKCSMRQKNEQAAIADAQEALALNPQYAHACELLFEAHKALSEFHGKEAETYLERRKQIIDPDGKYGELPLFRS